MNSFSYESAFARNVGWLTAGEQQRLRSARVAIGGLGGVGGSHLLTLARLGVGRFTIADLDTFELANLNRQAGAFVSTMERAKTEVLAGMARDINPEADVRIFDSGVDEGNVDAFLEGADVYLDGLDYFVVDIRRLVFNRCTKLRIPAVTAAPLGMGAAVLNFLPGGYTFEDYFRLEGHDEQEQLIRFLAGLSPAMLQRAYLVEPSAVDFASHRGPSTPMACEICAGMAGTQVVKIVLARGRLLVAPRGQQFDPYRNRYRRTWRPGGNNNPYQKLLLAAVRQQLKRSGL